MQVRRVHRSVAVIAAFIATMFSPVWATNGPRGLALDAKGNLYVGNQNSNQVLVYNSNYIQVPSKSITTGLEQPVAVVFDSKGMAYVANRGSQSITQYSSTDAQNTTFSITNGINNPWAIAIDAIDQFLICAGNPSILLNRFPEARLLITSCLPTTA